MIEGFFDVFEIVALPRSNQQSSCFVWGGGSDRALLEIARDRFVTSPWDLSD